MDIKNIMIIGSGLMGSGIAQVSAQAGYNVIMNDVKMEFIEKGFNSIGNILEGKVKKEKITVPELAHIFHTNRTTLTRQFHAVTGLPVISIGGGAFSGPWREAKPGCEPSSST